MATLNEVPGQLQAWIHEIDVEVDRLMTQRGSLVVALDAFDGLLAADVALHVALVPGSPKLVEQPKPSKAEPAKKAAAKNSAPGQSKYDYAEVARIANAAFRAGEPTNGAVASRFGVGKDMADQLIYKARKLGHDILRRGDKPAQTNVTTIATASRAFTPDSARELLDNG